MMDDPKISYSDDEEENFEDASENVPVASSMDLDTAIEETTVALNLFLNNKFNEAKARMEPWASKSFYHALGYGTIMYLQAAMTFEMNDIEEAVKVSKRSVTVCNKFRRKKSMLSSLSQSKSYYNEYTNEELHAEVCYAECLIERALLTFIQDENLISFVKGSLKIRACYNSYKECLKILEKRAWQEKDQKVHFESGVRMGVGMFNLMISLLPTKILKLLEFIGFQGNKQRGLSYLEAGAELEKSIRGPLCSMVLLGYHTVVTYVLGTADGDIELSTKLLKPCLARYPKGAMFLFFAGRIAKINANTDEAILKYEESIESQSEWKQFHHLCYWELMWCHCFKGDWLLAMKHAERLCNESRWSKATYMYQKAAFLMMCDDQTEQSHEHIKYLMGEVPKLKQRLAGKSIPIEKFAVRKAERYVKQNFTLSLPAYELMYVWNQFTIIGKKDSLLDPIMDNIEKTIQDILANKAAYPFHEDDYSLCLLLKGVCLKHKKSILQAEQCFTEIIQNDKQLKHDLYLAPYAMVELGLLYLDEGKLNLAKETLERAKTNYKGFSLESRLHFRIHAGHLKIKNLKGEDSTTSLTPPETPTTSEKPLDDASLNSEDIMTEL